MNSWHIVVCIMKPVGWITTQILRCNIHELTMQVHQWWEKLGLYNFQLITFFLLQWFGQNLPWCLCRIPRLICPGPETIFTFFSSIFSEVLNVKNSIILEISVKRSWGLQYVSRSIENGKHQPIGLRRLVQFIPGPDWLSQSSPCYHLCWKWVGLWDLSVLATQWFNHIVLGMSSNVNSARKSMHDQLHRITIHPSWCIISAGYLEIFIPPKFGFVDFWASTNDVVRGLLVILRFKQVI